MLLAAEGLPNAEIARRTGTSRPTVVDWRARYDAGGIRALDDQPRSGRPPEIDEIDVVVATLAQDGRPPAHLGVTHWSARLLAAELKISFATVARIWRKWNLQPWRIETFKFSTDPELDAKIRDVVGLYLHPPEKAVVLCIDEKSQVQALDRTAPILPIMPGIPERQTHDYIRNGTTTLFAALEVATGRVERACLPRHRHQEFLRSSTRSRRPTRGSSCTWSATTTPPTNTPQSTHGWPTTRGSPCTSPRPRDPGSTWSRSSSGSSPAKPSAAAPSARSANSIEAITAFIDGWNERCQPFVWTKDADTIIQSPP